MENPGDVREEEEAQRRRCKEEQEMVVSANELIRGSLNNVISDGKAPARDEKTVNEDYLA